MPDYIVYILVSLLILIVVGICAAILLNGLAPDQGRVHYFFVGFPLFSSGYYLVGEEEAFVRELFSKELISWFEEQSFNYVIDHRPDNLFLYKMGRLRGDALSRLSEDGNKLGKRLVTL